MLLKILSNEELIEIKMDIPWKKFQKKDELIVKEWILGFKYDCKNDGYLDFSIDLEKELVK